jgi:hypothetical protein
VRTVIAFVAASRNDGLLPFGLCWLDGFSGGWVVATVQYKGAALTFSRSYPGGAPLALPMWITASGKWCEA